PPPDGRLLSTSPGGYVMKTVTDAAHLAGANSNSGIAPIGATTSFARDPLGRTVAETNPRGAISQTSWNAIDQVWRIETCVGRAPWADTSVQALAIEPP